MEPHALRIGPGSVLQHYEVIRPLGRGGMGQVFLARDTRLGRLVAIKLLTEHSGEHAQRFLIEARATARLRHDNIVVIYELGEHNGTPYMVLEYLKGKTLQESLRERRDRGQEDRDDRDSSRPPPSEPAATGLPPSRAIELMIPVVRALVCAHDHGIIHRDLKPSNILLTDAGAVKVLDFGLAKVVDTPEPPAEAEPADTSVDSQDRLTLTQPGAVRGTQAYMSPEQWRGGPVDHRTDIWATGIVLAELVLGRHPLKPLSLYAMATIGVLQVPMPSLRELRPELGKLASIIDRCLLKRVEDRLGSARELCAELEALVPAARLSSPPGDGEHNPYAGLTAFREGDAARFFGRSGAVAEVITQLAEQPLLAIVGPSGAGKSSFVRAGVIPALGGTGDAWAAFTIRPGPHPLAALAELLLADTFQTSSYDASASGPGSDAWLTEDREGLDEKLRLEPGLLGARLRALSRRRLKRVLLFVDQTEELYTLAPEQDRAAFFACLAGVADDVGSPLRVVLAIRSDFLDRVAEARAAMNALRRGILLLPPMDREGLREALVRPLEAVEHRFEPPELIEEMLNALEHTAAALPLLSFTAAKLWEQRDRTRRLLTEESYRRMDGIGGALAGHADAVLGAMSPEERALARVALLRLVTPERTRALCTLTELRELGPAPPATEPQAAPEPGSLPPWSGIGVRRPLQAPPAMERVLGRLIDARLLTVEGGGEADATVEIVHESLITGWPTLAGWVAENQEDAVFLSRLRHAAREWEAGGRSEDLLWRGQAAEGAKRWRERYSGELAPGEERYLRAVVELAERARQRRRRIAAGATAMLAVFAVVVSFLAIRASRAAAWAREEAASADQAAVRAQNEARQARNATRIAAARELQADPTTVLALLREVEPPDLPRGWSELARWALYAGVARVVLTHADVVHAAAWSPDGQRIVTASIDKIARVWSADGTGEPLLLRGHENAVLSAAWSPDGTRIVTASRDKTARIWRADGTGEPLVLRGHEDIVWSAAWSPDGTRIVTASRDKTARVWSAEGKGEPLILRGHEASVQSVAWSPDGKRIVTASQDKTVRVWSADGTGEPLILRGHEDEVSSVAWSPDGKRIVTASQDKTARVWNADGTGEPLILRGHEDSLYSAAWSPDGKRIVTASRDKTARVWSTDGPSEPLIFRGHARSVNSVAFSPDGERILTASQDKTARIWSADGTGEPLILRGHDDAVISAAWSPDGKRVVTASQDKTARIWSADGTGKPMILGDHDDILWSVAFSPDGKRIVTASQNKIARIWSADGTGEPLVLRGHEDAVFSAAWSPDGKRIVTASRDKTARVWSADGTGEPLILRGHEDAVDSAAWSPDGKRIVTASWDRTAREWSADGTGEPLVLRGHEHWANSAAWSPDGKRIVTASQDKTVQVWNADGTGEPLVLRGAAGAYNRAVFSPDGHRIAATSDDNTVSVWTDLEPLRGANDPRLWTATTYCIPMERRIKILGVPEAIARADQDACLRRVDAARPVAR